MKSCPKIFLVCGSITAKQSLPESLFPAPLPSPLHRAAAEVEHRPGPGMAGARAAAEAEHRPGPRDGRSQSHWPRDAFLPGRPGEEPQLLRSWAAASGSFITTGGVGTPESYCYTRAAPLSQLVTRQRLVQRACVLSTSEKDWEGQEAREGNVFPPQQRSVEEGPGFRSLCYVPGWPRKCPQCSPASVTSCKWGASPQGWLRASEQLASSLSPGLALGPHRVKVRQCRHPLFSIEVTCSPSWPLQAGHVF